MKQIEKQRTGRQAYDAAFKLKVVYEALQRPAGSRIKPTCRDYPDIEPVRCPHARIVRAPTQAVSEEGRVGMGGQDQGLYGGC